MPLFLTALELALADFDVVLEQTPNNITAQVNRGLIYVRLGEYELALADADAILALTEAFSDAHRLRGDALLGLGDTAGAIAAYQDYLAWAGDQADPLVVGRLAELLAE